MKILKWAGYVLVFTLVFAACSEGDDIKTQPQPIAMQADGEWFENSILEGEELWFKVSCSAGATNVTFEWSEKDAHGTERNYTADVVVSTYQLDGESAYFEDKDNGYKEQGKTFDLGNEEAEFLVKVVVGEANISGTFALRAKASSSISVSYTDLAIGNWKDSVISENEVIGFKVKYSGEQKLKVIWAEIGTPEEGYTANVTGSVLNKDATEYYSVFENGSGFFQDKKKSHSDDAKIILTNPDENNFKIQLKGVIDDKDGGVENGTFAIKVIEVTE